MQSRKGSHRIVVGKVEYRWQAKGGDGFIGISIWPVNNIGPFVLAHLQYHETAGDQIVVTNRIIRQIIEHAICKYGYDPLLNGNELNLGALDDVVTWQSAVRATRKPPPQFRTPGAALISPPRSSRKAIAMKQRRKNNGALRMPVHEASFKVRAEGFPEDRWSEFLKAFKTRSSRRTGRRWHRTDGSGFTIWISDVDLIDSRVRPPIWEIRVEALVSLNPAGQECWKEVCQGIELFIQNSGLDRIDGAS